MIDLKKLEVWFITGSQFLYGDETLKQVGAHAQQIVKELSGSPLLPVTLVLNLF
jgi:L-arabinose isomerase